MESNSCKHIVHIAHSEADQNFILISVLQIIAMKTRKKKENLDLLQSSEPPQDLYFNVLNHLGNLLRVPKLWQYLDMQPA
jgi:hypothetical protein